MSIDEMLTNIVLQLPNFIGFVVCIILQHYYLRREFKTRDKLLAVITHDKYVADQLITDNDPPTLPVQIKVSNGA